MLYLMKRSSLSLPTYSSVRLQLHKRIRLCQSKHVHQLRDTCMLVINSYFAGSLQCAVRQVHGTSAIHNIASIQVCRDYTKIKELSRNFMHAS
jgi:hypothetical protein